MRLQEQAYRPSLAKTTGATPSVARPRRGIQCGGYGSRWCHVPEHFERLACFHFRRWTINQIAEEFGGEHGKEDRSVTHGINDTAALFGLTIERRRGRPPKTDP